MRPITRHFLNQIEDPTEKMEELKKEYDLIFNRYIDNLNSTIKGNIARLYYSYDYEALVKIAEQALNYAVNSSKHCAEVTGSKIYLSQHATIAWYQQIYNSSLAELRNMVIDSDALTVLKECEYSKLRHCLPMPDRGWRPELLVRIPDSYKHITIEQTIDAIVQLGMYDESLNLRHIVDEALLFAAICMDAIANVADDEEMYDASELFIYKRVLMKMNIPDQKRLLKPEFCKG